MLDPVLCRRRQQRLLAVMERQGFEAVILGSARNVYYFTAFQPFWVHETAFVLSVDGRGTLYTANEPAANVAADDVRAFPASFLGTVRQDQPAVISAEIIRTLAASPWKRVGVDASPVASAVMGVRRQWVTVEDELFQLRRQKDADELALMRRAITCTQAMYRRAREIIEPGVPTLRVYNELHAAAVAVAGEPLWPAYLGNDFACGVPGGPASAGRVASAGELYILDLGPAYRGYFSDNSRTFAVDRKPTDAQLTAWRTVVDVFPIVERLAKPGARCRDLFAAADEHYRERTGNGFPHHLGHGVGLQPHEFPHLNPRWDDVLLEGEVFTAEPGLYGPDLRAGMRIENQYLVTATGVENLTPFPLEL